MTDSFSHLVMPSPIGTLTLFAADGALVAIEAGAAPTAGEGSPVLIEARKQLNDYFDGNRKTFDLPMDPAGTPRQKEIWAAMSNIPYGETRTYGELARSIRSAARAVGGACARNPIPIVIPCHRVLGADGGVGNYSFADGPDTKERLLILEGHEL